MIAAMGAMSFKVHAGLDVADYMPQQEQRLSGGDARQQEAQVLSEQLAAQRLAAQVAELEARAEARLALERASRPLGERLMEQRCLTCHPVELIMSQPRSRLAWTALIWRMQWINGAVLEAGEREVIGAWLAEKRGAPARRAVIEWAALALALLLIVAYPVWRFWRRRESS